MTTVHRDWDDALPRSRPDGCAPLGLSRFPGRKLSCKRGAFSGLRKNRGFPPDVCRQGVRLLPHQLGHERRSDKDSLARQKAAVAAYARAHSTRIADEFYDAAVSGADPIEARPGFLDVLARIAGNGVRCILVETANRFARDLIVQETGWRFLQAKGIELIAVDSPEAFLADTPTAVLIRQILGAVSQFEKASLVAKLKVARVRKRRQTGKCKGRKGYAETAPALVEHVRNMRRAGFTLDQVGTALQAEGPFAPAEYHDCDIGDAPAWSDRGGFVLKPTFIKKLGRWYRTWVSKYRYWNS